jgi:hypothetical protein
MVRVALQGSAVIQLELLQEPAEAVDLMVSQGLQEFQVHQEAQEQVVIVVHEVLQGEVEYQVLTELLEAVGLMEVMVVQGHRVQAVILVLMVQVEAQGLQAPMA